jgi:hypothetical protein
MSGWGVGSAEVGRVTWTRTRWRLLLAASVAARAPLAAWLPLSGDEAYYWDCSRHLDWSYFDQPGLAIWAMVPFRALLGETALAVRAPALLAGVLIAMALERLIRRLGGDLKDAATAFLLLHATPLFFLGSAYASTDVILLAAYATATCAAVAIAQGERRAWWAFGSAVGLGILGKFPMVLVLAVLLPLLRQPVVRVHLRTATPYLAGALAVTLTAPIWIWSARHGGADIAFHLHRIPTGFDPANVVLFWAASALTVTPFLAVAMVLAWKRCMACRDAGWAAYRMASAVPLLFFSAVAARGYVGMHWGAPSLVLGMVPVVLCPVPGWRRLARAGALTGAAMIVTALSVVLFPRSWLALETAVRGFQGRPEKVELVELFGVQEIAAEVARRLRDGEIAATGSYSDVHLLTFASAGRLPLRLAKVSRGRHGLASLYWHRPEELEGRDVLFFSEDDRLQGRLAGVCDAAWEDAPRFVVELDGKPLRTVLFVRCRGLRRAELFTRLPATPATARDARQVGQWKDRGLVVND